MILNITYMPTRARIVVRFSIRTRIRVVFMQHVLIPLRLTRFLCSVTFDSIAAMLLCFQRVYMNTTIIIKALHDKKLYDAAKLQLNNIDNLSMLIAVATGIVMSYNMLYEVHKELSA